MFVVSIKASKRQLVSIICCIVMLISIIVVAVLWPDNEAAAQTNTVGVGGTHDERITFLTKLGYEIDASSPKVKEVLIPDEFDDVFELYNSIQLEAGMDLTPYHGKRVKCWSYRVLNISTKGEVMANLYIFKDKIIGGDISSTALDGFMYGLLPAGTIQTGMGSSTSATTTKGTQTSTTAKK